jgi:phosphoglycolate phosphatase
VVKQLLAEHRKPPLSRDSIYHTVSDGARALVKLAFGIDEDHAEFVELTQRLLHLYYQQLQVTDAALYPGLDGLLAKLERQQIPWGIVTNKPEKYTSLLLDKLNLRSRCGTLVTSRETPR